jgi:hypothetical protein
MKMSDEIKQTRLTIIQRLNGKEITLDIVVKYIAIFFPLEWLKFTSVSH